MSITSFLLNESFIQEQGIGADQAEAHKAGHSSDEGDGQEMDRSRTEDDKGAHLKEIGDLDGIEN